jgi:dolichol-phosphate mannosyltransferase
MVGVLGIAVNAIALVAFTEGLGLHYALSAILASQVSTLHNFILTELWVFGGREARRHLVVRYLTFNALNVATLTVRVPVLVLFTEWVGLHYLVSNLIAIGLTFGVRYFIAENWIWAGRDARDQAALDGWFHYDIHGLARVRSRIALPELAAFNSATPVQPDIEVDRHRGMGGFLRPRVSVTAEGSVIRYREQLGAAGVAFDIHLDDSVRVDANWLLAWSHHVLYTNVVEPLLRFLLVSRGAVLLHCASVDTEHGALLLSAKTDTGKTSTLLRLLMHQPWGFMGDDMAIVLPDGRILSYPKPMTLSSHTMSAVSDAPLPFADRFMLAIRSRVHSKQGRSIGHALSRLPIPIVTVNALVQLVVPPPKYFVTSLVDCDMVDEAPLHAVLLMERGQPVVEDVAMETALDELLANTEDAYTFPPFGWLAPYLRFRGMDLAALRALERDLLRDAVAGAWRTRLRVAGHEWAEAIPTLLDGRASAAAPQARAARARVGSVAG